MRLWQSLSVPFFHVAHFTVLSLSLSFALPLFCRYTNVCVHVFTFILSVAFLLRVSCHSVHIFNYTHFPVKFACARLRRLPIFVCNFFSFVRIACSSMTNAAHNRAKFKRVSLIFLQKHRSFRPFALAVAPSFTILATKHLAKSSCHFILWHLWILRSRRVKQWTMTVSLVDLCCRIQQKLVSFMVMKIWNMK